MLSFPACHMTQNIHLTTREEHTSTATDVKEFGSESKEGEAVKLQPVFEIMALELKCTNAFENYHQSRLQKIQGIYSL